MHHVIDSLQDLNKVSFGKIRNFERLIAFNDSMDSVKKQEHFSLPVKERIAKVKNAAPNVTVTDNTFTAGVELADTIELYKINLNTCKANSALKDSTIKEHQDIHHKDSLSIAKAVTTATEENRKAVKAEGKVKKLTFWLKIVGTVAAVSTLVALVR